MLCHHTECHCVECHYAERHYSKRHYAEGCYSERSYAEHHYCERHYAERRYDECRGAVQRHPLLLFQCAGKMNSLGVYSQPSYEKLKWWCPITRCILRCKVTFES